MDRKKAKMHEKTTELNGRGKSGGRGGKFQEKNGVEGRLLWLNFGLDQEESGLSSEIAPVLALLDLF